MTRIILAMGLVATSASAAPLQDRAGRPPTQDQDVVVVAPALPRSELPTKVVPGTNAGVLQRTIFDNSRRVAKCAMRTSLPKLREAIDGAPNSAPQRAAQAWLIRRTTTCNADAAVVARIPAGGSSALGATTSATMDSYAAQYGLMGAKESFQEQSAAGTSVYDRGALIEQVLRTYAPDLTLTERETGDRTVQGRFNLRESVRNGYRLSADVEYFKAAVCMVRIQPRQAVRLLHTAPGSPSQARYQANIINNARICVGNARKVYVDATQFRIYIIDALYRWALAARDVPSLIPADAVATR